MADHQNYASADKDKNENSQQAELPLYDEVTRYAKQVCASIRSTRVRVATEAEIFDHIQNALYEEALRGIPPERAFPVICASFGDQSVLRQQLAGVHNRLPPDFWRTLGVFLLRLGAAALLGGIIWGFAVNGGDTLRWYHLVPSILILFGSHPVWAVCHVLHRLHFRSRIKRIARNAGYEILRLPSLPEAILGNRKGDILLCIRGKVVCIRFLFLRRGEGLRFVDETAILRIRRHPGVGLMDRRPGQFNLSKTAAVGHTALRPATFSYILPPMETEGFNTEKLLVIDHFPKELSVVDGNAARELIAGDHVFDFAVHTRKSCLNYVLKCMDTLQKGNSQS